MCVRGGRSTFQHQVNLAVSSTTLCWSMVRQVSDWCSNVERRLTHP
eukprot:COSAG01_NODE_43432_length_429_cov_2540.763636_1_plen_45_part_10